MEKTVLVGLILFLVTGSAAQLDAEISTSCDPDYEPVISMQDSQSVTSNPGPPSLYDEKLCVNGIREAEIKYQCESGSMGFYLSSNGTDSHFSKLGSYNLPVCTGQMITTVRDSCLTNQTELFSVSSEHNGHVAEPGFYDKDVCGFYAPPENVTVSVDFNLSSQDQVYFDDTQIGENEFSFAEFPYMVSQSTSHVSGLVTSEFLYGRRTLAQKNSLEIRKDSSDASFLFPLTRGNYETIERHQQRILQGTFLNQLQPSFAFYIPEEATVRASLSPNANLSGGISLQRGRHTIDLTKTGENEITIEKR